MKVVIIEDDINIVESVTLTFQVGWPDVDLTYTRLGQEGIDIVGNETCDMILLDLGLPDMSGFEVLKQIRAFSGVPIIILTVRSDEQSVVKALEWGADDYIIKPFRQLELLARIKAAMRKLHMTGEEPPLQFGKMLFYPASRKISTDGKVKYLTNTESLIFYHLLLNRGQVLTYSILAEKIWGRDYSGSIDTLRCHIKNLRKKIESPCQSNVIKNTPGVGYSISK
jgi:DNA-binding response OmpR family regulator